MWTSGRRSWKSHWQYCRVYRGKRWSACSEAEERVHGLCVSSKMHGRMYLQCRKRKCTLYDWKVHDPGIFIAAIIPITKRYIAGEWCPASFTNYFDSLTARSNPRRFCQSSAENGQNRAPGKCWRISWINAMKFVQHEQGFGRCTKIKAEFWCFLQIQNTRFVAHLLRLLCYNIFKQILGR